MSKKTREQQHLVGIGPDVRLVLGDPVDLGLGAKVIHRGLQAREFEQPTPGPSDPPFDLGLPLIEPEHGRAQRLALLIHIDQGAALGSQ